MKKRLAAAGLVAACAACCAPLLLPVLAGAGLIGVGTVGGGLLAGIPLDALICGALPLAALAGFAIWSYRRRKAALAQCNCESLCGTTACGSSLRAASTSL